MAPTQRVLRRRGGVFALTVTMISACDANSRIPSTPSLDYPAAKTGDVADVYHGTRVADPYRWFEEIGAPEVQDWAAAQNALVTRFVRGDSLRGWFLQRMQHHGKVWDQTDGSESGPVGPGTQFRLSASADSSYDLLRIHRDGRVLDFIDPHTFGSQTRIARFEVSPDGKYVAYALSEGGSEWVQTRIRRVADGIDLPEVLDGMLGGTPLWSRDSRGFFYVHQKRDDTHRVMLLEPSARYHAINTPQSADRILFATPPGSVESVLQLSFASEKKYLIISEGSGALWEEFSWVLSRMHVLDLGDAAVPALTNPVVPLTPDKVAGYRVVASEGSMLYVMTDRDAPRKRVVAVDVRDPSPQKWRDIIPQDAKLVLHSMRRIKNRFVGVYLADVQPLIRTFDKDGRPLQNVTLPPFSNIIDLSPGEGASELEVGTASFLQSPTLRAVDVLTGKSKVAFATTTDFDTASFQTRQEWYTSHDGTRVPIFVVHRKNIVMDGSHPVLMLGYGASGTVELPNFSEDVLAWLEAGGVFAMPSLRGGGEFGREWYDAAILGRKQNTIDDFIAAAEWLIRSGYTKPEKLAIRGASNGGQLVAATITQRPDLFGVAIAEVPITDNLRYDRGRHRGQFGHVSDSAQFAYLFRYSPLHRVRPGTCYPATLITTVMNDDRAPAWLAFKFAAALQSAQGCDKPILLRVEDVGGHLGERGRNSWTEDRADALAFAARQFGMRVTSPSPVVRAR